MAKHRDTRAGWMQGASRHRGQGIGTNPQRDAVCLHGAANAASGKAKSREQKGLEPPAQDQSLLG